MVSKKNIIGLSMLLLVFLLGLSTTCYAKISDDFTYEEFQNIIYNMITNEGTRYTDWAESVIEDNSATLEMLYTYDRENYFIGRNVNGNQGLYIGFYDSNTTSIVGSSPNYRINLVNSSGQNKLVWTLPPNMNFNTINTETVYNGRSIDMEALPYFVSTYSFSGQGQTVPAGCNPSRITSGPYESAPADPELYFEPIAPIGYRDFTVGQNLGLVVRGVTKNNTYTSMKFGDLYVPSYYYIKDIEVVWYYYNKNTGNWLGKYMLHEYGDDLTPDFYRSTIFNFKFEDSFKENDTTIVHYSLWGNRNYVLENCVYQFEIQSTKFQDGLLEFDGNAFYILDSNTVIGDDGVLDTGFLDTGPYSDQYLNDVEDTAKKVDELDDLINGVETGVGNLFLPASGDWFPLNELASGDDLLGTAFLWGYKNYDNPYWTALYGLMNNILTTLTQTGNVEITFTLNGNNYTYNSNYVRLPDGPLKTWLSLATTFLFVVAIYRLFNRKLEKIKMADSTVLKYSAEDSNLL